MSSEQAKESLWKTGKESYHASNRRILVIGPSGTGKTTFSCSGSKFAGENTIGDDRNCEDVILLQGDSEGAMGAETSGLKLPYVLDLTVCETWSAYQQMLKTGLNQMWPLLKQGKIRIVVLDLALPQRLIEDQIKPQGPEGWGLVRSEGMKLYNLFSKIRGVTIVGNAQVKSTTVIAKRGNIEEATEKAAVTAIGGELSAYSVDLARGVAALWKENASFIFCREARRMRTAEGEEEKKYFTHTQSSRRFEAKSRAASILPARINGNISLNFILKQVYGDSDEQQDVSTEESKETLNRETDDARDGSETTSAQ